MKMTVQGLYKPMSYRFTLVLWLVAALMIAACSAETGNSPRLVGESTTTGSQSTAITQLPTLIEMPTNTPTLSEHSELMSPVQVVTVPADFVIVTPTLPPSKTPSETPTETTTPTVSPTPTITVTATQTAPTFPTAILTPTPAVVSNPITELCLSAWEYIYPPPVGCPIYPASVGQGVYQTFERGYMFWLMPQEIYVLYNDGGTPHWTRYTDTFIEGTGKYPHPPWKDTGYWDSIAPAGLWQPVRGFGKLWRNDDETPQNSVGQMDVVRSRIGWATMEFEQPYSAVKQVRTDGTIFIRDPNGRFFQLIAGGAWSIYAGNSTLPPDNNTAPEIPIPGFP